MSGGGLGEIVAFVVAVVAVGVGIHEVWLYHGPTGIWGGNPPATMTLSEPSKSI